MAPVAPTTIAFPRSAPSASDTHRRHVARPRRAPRGRSHHRRGREPARGVGRHRGRRAVARAPGQLGDRPLGRRGDDRGGRQLPHGAVHGRGDPPRGGAQLAARRRAAAGLRLRGAPGGGRVPRGQRRGDRVRGAARPGRGHDDLDLRGPDGRSRRGPRRGVPGAGRPPHGPGHRRRRLPGQPPVRLQPLRVRRAPRPGRRPVPRARRAGPGARQPGRRPPGPQRFRLARPHRPHLPAGAVPSRAACRGRTSRTAT